MTQDELMLEVSRLYEEKWGVADTWLARAAIALVLEVAARVADEEANRHWDNGHGFRDGTALHIAAAIRALKEGK